MCGDRIRGLPAEMAPPYNWQEFQRRSQDRLRRPGGYVGWGHMAAAAALLLLVCGVAVWGRLERGISESVSSERVSGDVLPQVREVQTASNETNAAARSRAIDSWLATLPREPVVVRVGTRAAVARLEDRIAQVDDLLTSVRLDGMRPDHLAALQRERVQLVGSLAQVRYAEVVAAESP